MAAIDPIELGKWERMETERGRWARGVRGVWHNYTPKLLGWTVSPARLLLGSLSLFCVLALALHPIALKVYDHTNTLSAGETGTYCAVLVAMLGYRHFHEKAVKDSKPKTTADKLRAKLVLELSGVTKSIGDAVKIRNKDHQHIVDAGRARTLDCIKDATRIRLGDLEGAHVEVTLLLFDDAECSRIRVASRTTHSRPSGTVKPAAEVMAYYVAKSRKHRVIYDFPNDDHPFPKTSLSGGKPPYRSILMIPLLDSRPGGQDTCIGVVTVDSTKPYHFWRGNGEELVLELTPYLTLLTLFLNLNDPHRLNYSAQ